MMRAPSGIASPRRPVGVAAAVPALVRVAHERREALEAPACAGASRSPTTGWSRTSARSRAASAAGVVEHGGRDGELADVVQQRRVRDRARRRHGDAEPPADGRREDGDVDAVVEEATGAERLEHRADRGGEGWGREHGDP